MAAARFPLERNIVVGNLRAASAAPGKVVSASGRFMLFAAVACSKAAATRCAVATATQHAEIRGYNFKAGALLPLFVLPLARLDAPFDENKRAFLQVLLSDLRLFAPNHNFVPFRALLALAVFVAVGFVGRQGKIGDRLPASGVAGLRVAAEAADKDYFVD